MLKYLRRDKIIQAHLYLHSTTLQKSRWVNITSLGSQLGQDMCDALLGAHALIGCDTVSALAGKGKKKA